MPSAIQSMIEIADELQEWVIHARPVTEEEKDQMRQVLAQRWALEQKLNQLFAYRLQLTMSAVPGETAELAQLSKKLTAVERRIETASSVIRIAGTALTVAAKLLTLALA